ncbi:hypothetical protein GCM10009557_00450 [Virgisporangium ochraceum]|uniref:Uncharacterized protein n=1 Tax=Virgisporangium ochraceum TaxID=65505 RepID=A0A8J4A3Y7_9ACTN|nr:hypothetical protein [Virgisporangium ochraceum]GIJ74077.1 hypothetical protein Voc01_089940 [Virgisporangium ochraceum]
MRSIRWEEVGRPLSLAVTWAARSLRQPPAPQRKERLSIASDPTPAAIIQDHVVALIHAESIHISERHDTVMQGQERTLALVVTAVGATLAFAAGADYPEVYCALPIALSLIFTFTLHLYADAAAKIAYHEYLQTLINTAIWASRSN